MHRKSIFTLFSAQPGYCTGLSGLPVDVYKRQDDLVSHDKDGLAEALCHVESLDRERVALGDRAGSIRCLLYTSQI